MAVMFSFAELPMTSNRSEIICTAQDKNSYDVTSPQIFPSSLMAVSFLISCLESILKLAVSKFEVKMLAVIFLRSQR